MFEIRTFKKTVYLIFLKIPTTFLSVSIFAYFLCFLNSQYFGLSLDSTSNITLSYVYLLIYYSVKQQNLAKSSCTFICEKRKTNVTINSTHRLITYT